MFFCACNKPQEPVFKEIKNLKVSKLSNGQLGLTADAHYFNPNKMKGKLAKIDLDLEIEGQKVGTVNQAELVEVPANAEFVIPLEANVSSKFLSDNWLGGIVSILQSGKVPVRIYGSATIKILEIPVKVPIEHTEDISLKNLF